MPGLESVYLRQAGTGAAWMGPGSSFDPVQFAKYAGAVKMAQQQQEQQKKQKVQDDFFKSIKVKGGKVLADDWNFISQKQDDFYNWAAAESTKYGGVTPQMMARGQQEASKLESDFARLGVHKEKADTYHKLILSSTGGQNPIYDADAMYKNEAIYTQPYQYLDDPQYGSFINETWTPMFEEAMKDPINQMNPERTAKEVTLDWRDNYGEQFIGTPIYNPISLQNNFKSNVQPLLSEIKKYKSVRDAAGNVITEENLYTLPEDAQVEVELDDGTKQTITMPGIRTIASDNFETDPVVARSAEQLFYKQGEDVVNQYQGEYGQDAVKNWYMDQAQNWGVQATSKTVKQAPLPKEGRYGYGGKNYPFKVSYEEKTFNLNRAGREYDKKGGGNIVFDYAEVPARGFSFGSDKNKFVKVQVNPQRIFDQDSYSWVKERSKYGKNLDFTVAGVYETPAAAEDINLNDPIYKDFLVAAGKKYGKATHTALQNHIRKGEFTVSADTPLSKWEAKQLKKINKKLIKTGRFAFGEINGINENTGDKLTIQGAIIPYDEVSTQVDDATQGDWNFEFDQNIGEEPDWWDDSPEVDYGEKGSEQKSRSTKKASTLEDYTPATSSSTSGAVTWE